MHRQILKSAFAALVLSAGATAVAEPLGGSVLDGIDLQPIPGATLSTSTGATTTSDAAGRFRFDDLPAGTVDLRVEAEGFETSDESVVVPEGGLLDQVFVLFAPGAAGEIIEVAAEPTPRVSPPPGKQDLPREEMTRIPGARGDALTSIKSLPGVASVDAPGSGPGLLVIRGSAPEDSKINIDGIQVPILYHFFGFQSVIPSEFIQNIDYLPGGFGVDEGRATGGVINVTTRSDHPEEVEGFTELSFVNAAGFAHGPLYEKENLSFAVGFRRSLIDFILPLALPDDADLSFTTAPKYYDAQLRVDWRPNFRHRVTVLQLLSSDRLTLINDNIDPNEPLATGTFNNESGFNRTIAAWYYEGDRVESRAVLSYGGTTFGFEVGTDRFLHLTGDRIETRHDLVWKADERASFRAGADGRLDYGDINSRFPLPPAEGSGQQFNFSTQPLVEQMESTTNHVAGAYMAADLKLGSNTTLSPGARLDYYDRFSAATWSPRVSLVQQLNERLSAKLALGTYSRPAQWAESLTTSVGPETATQYVLGGDYKIRDDLGATVSGFYTDRRQLIVQDPFLAREDPVNSYVNRGFGRSYGVETILRARADNYFGWLAYTLSRSDRIDGPNSDRRLFDYDQTHNFVAVGSYRLGTWEFGARWQYATGIPETPVIGAVFNSDFNVHLPVLGQINSSRFDSSHQLDVRVDRKWTFQSWELSAFLDVSNLYAHPKVLGYRYNFDYSDREAITELPIFPAIGIRGSF